MNNGNIFEQVESKEEKQLKANIKEAVSLATQIGYYFDIPALDLIQESDYSYFELRGNDNFEILIFSDKIEVRVFGEKVLPLFKEVAKKSDITFEYNDKHLEWDNLKINVLKGNSPHKFVYPCTIDEEKGLGLKFIWNEEHKISKTVFLKNIIKELGYEYRI